MNKIMHPIEPEELMAYLDGELPADRAKAAAAHLGECAECQSLASELGDVSQSLKTWEVELAEAKIPEPMESALEAHVGKKVGVADQTFRNIRKPRWWRHKWTPILAAAAVPVVVVIGVVSTTMLRSGGEKFETVARIEAGPDREQVALAPPPPPPVSSGTASLQSRSTFGLQVEKPHDAKSPSRSAEANVPSATGPMIIRTAQLSLITKEFDTARSSLEAILKRHRGYVGELKVGGTAGSGRTLTATLRVPADQLDGTLTEAKALGRVESETQSGEDVTSQYVDLQARLANARNTSQRLTDLLQNRTGKLSDVLEVEQELDRVRGEIEQMEAERKNMANQVSFATLNVTVSEDYKAQLQVVPPSTWTRLSNAAVEGYRNVVEGVLSVALFLLTTGPTLLLWGVVLFLPTRFVWKKVQRPRAQ